MTERDFELTRRRVLGALGTIGVASAGAGLGTSAYFSDQETFANNELTAGSLDMKVGWDEHYSDWSDDESTGLEFMPVMDLADIPDSNPNSLSPDPSQESSWVPFPTPNDPELYVYSGDVSTFMDNTRLERFPSNGIGQNENPCNVLGDAPEDLDNVGGDRPVVELDDVKPGDFGEVTFSFALCDNPGYVWLNGNLLDESENTVTEPEADDPQENNQQSDSAVSDSGELADTMQVAMWYDDGDNVAEGGRATGGQELEVALVLDSSGSMGSGPGSLLDQSQEAAKNFVDNLSQPDEGASVSFGTTAAVDQELTTDYQAVKTAIDNPTTSGSTDMAAGISAAENELLNGTNATAGANKVMILLSDGAPDSQSDATSAANSAKDNGITLYTIAFGQFANESFLESIATSSDTAFTTTGGQTLTQIYNQIATQIITQEEILFQGSLRDALSVMSTDNGIPLDGDQSTAYDEVTGTDTNGDGFPDQNLAPGTGADPNRECYQGTSAYHVGFAWWLPVDHGNEVQTDSVTFDLGFYTEQCRHNDGAGMNNDAVAPAETDA